MSSHITRILDIENQAQKIVSEAKMRQENFDEELNAGYLEEEKKISFDTDQKILLLKKKMLDDVNKKCELLRKNTEQSIDQMNGKFDKKKDNWTDLIFKNIIGS